MWNDREFIEPAADDRRGPTFTCDNVPLMAQMIATNVANCNILPLYFNHHLWYSHCTDTTLFSLGVFTTNEQLHLPLPHHACSGLVIAAPSKAPMPDARCPMHCLRLSVSPIPLHSAGSWTLRETLCNCARTDGWTDGRAKHLSNNLFLNNNIS